MLLISVYRRFFTHVTGSDCRAKFAGALAIIPAKTAYRGNLTTSLLTACFLMLLPQSAASQIDLPPPPVAAPPPALPRERDPVVIRESEKKAAAAEDATQRKDENVQREDARRAEVAKAEAVKPRPLYGFVELSLLYPKVTVSGDREDYRADMTTHVHFWIRPNFDKLAQDVQLWLGLRLAPFAGYGTQNRQKGRFGLTYFGPGLGFGKISAPDETGSDLPTRSGWLVAGGIAAVSRLGNRDEEHSGGSTTDFHTKSTGFDSPGVWSEARTIHVFRGALSANLILGAQLAEQKNFYYFGIGLAGWL